MGKSALVNALIGHEAHETGLATPSRSDQTIDWHLAGGESLRVVDTGGFDGSARRDEAVLAQMDNADMVIWVHRADRPARAADAALLAAWSDAHSATPDRRAPPLLHVVTGVDRVLPGWPRPENQLTRDDQTRLAAITNAVSEALGGPRVVPVSVGPVEWNLNALRQELDACQPQARLAQRSRLRLAAERGTGLSTNARRAGRGMGKLASRFLPWVTRR
ncbi:MAG: GTPase [Paracoccaceae bacterium]